MKHSESLKEIAPALTKAQADFKPINRDKTVTVRSDKGSYTFAYAPLESITGAVRHALCKHGLTFTQGIMDDKLVSTLVHSSGEWMSNEIPIIKGAQSGPQAYGSAVTYARRYGLTMLLGIVADEDDDANSAEGNAVTAAPAKKDGTTRPAKHSVDDYSAPNGMPENDTLEVIRTVKEASEWLAQGNVDDAVLAKENAYLDADQTVFFWTFFDSKQRSAMKTAHEALIKRYNKQPETV